MMFDSGAPTAAILSDDHLFAAWLAETGSD